MTQTSNEAPAPEAPKRKGGISFRLVVHALKQHPIVLTVVVLVALAAGAGVWFFLPLPKMTGSVVFQVAARTPAVIAATSESNAGLDSYRQAQATMIKRRLLLNDVLKQPKVSAAGDRKATTRPACLARERDYCRI